MQRTLYSKYFTNCLIHGFVGKATDEDLGPLRN